MEGPRPVTAAEYREAIGLIDEIFHLSQGLPATILPECPVVLGRANMRRMWIVKEDDLVVSHSAYQAQPDVTPRGDYGVGYVSAVVTHADYRGRGHAKSIMSALHAAMREEGLDAAMLGTGIPDFYRPLGYEYAGEEFRFELGPELFKPKRFGGVIRLFRDADVEAMRRLHRRKPHRVERSREAFAALLHCPREKPYVAEFDGQVVAYAVVGKGEDYANWVVDWAGDLGGILGCIAEGLAGRTKPLTISLPEADGDLAGELTDMGIPLKAGASAMVKIVNLGSILAKTCGKITGEQSDDRFTLRAAGEEFTTDDAGVVSRLVFGPESARELIAAAPEPVLAACEEELPLPLYVPALDHV